MKHNELLSLIEEDVTIFGIKVSALKTKLLSAS